MGNFLFLTFLFVKGKRVISADFIIMFQYQCSSIIVRMMFCTTPRLFLVLHVASPLYCISFFSSIYFPAIVISSWPSLTFNCIKSVLDNRFPMSQNGPQRHFSSGILHHASAIGSFCRLSNILPSTSARICIFLFTFTIYI